MKYLKISMLFLVLTFVACEPEEKIEIGTPPQASFSYDFVDANNVTFKNTTSDEHFIVNWDVESNGTYSDDEIAINFLNAGDYEVKFTVFGKGGSTTKTEIITITQDDPSNCEATLQFLTGCGTKTWSLFSGAGALFVGPDDGTGATWWASAAGDVSLRDCDWNDEYTFKKDNSVFEYDSKGDFWGESYTGVSPDGCANITDLDASQAAWGDGTHAFEIILSSDLNVTPHKLKVVGNGAFLGLRKAANGAEVTVPQSSVTYDIIDTRTENGKDILEIQVSFGGGLWRFLLES